MGVFEGHTGLEVKEQQRGGYQLKDVKESMCKDLMYFFKVKQRVK